VAALNGKMPSLLEKLTKRQEIREFMLKRVPDLLEYTDNNLDLIFVNRSLV